MAQLSINSISFGTNNARMIDFTPSTNLYYVLFRGADLTALTQAVDVTLANPTNMFTELADNSPLAATGFYRVVGVPLSAPRDLDGDGISDVFELNYPTCLDPLNNNDATNDCDSDGLTNLQEFQAGTDPTIFNTIVSGLVINEVDYDQVGSDTAEFIELLNRANVTLDLSGLAVVLVNGANNLEYRRILLDGTLGPGEFLILATPLVTLPLGVRVITLPQAADNVQNGAPDGIAIIDLARGILVDALSYEGSITAATLTGLAGTSNLVEGTATSAADNNTSAGSLVRFPNGNDTDDAVTDWRFSPTLTPGAPNP